jgi:hypothetical protein
MASPTFLPIMIHYLLIIIVPYDIPILVEVLAAERYIKQKYRKGQYTGKKQVCNLMYEKY